MGLLRPVLEPFFWALFLVTALEPLTRPGGFDTWPSRARSGEGLGQRRPFKTQLGSACGFRVIPLRKHDSMTLDLFSAGWMMC